MPQIDLRKVHCKGAHWIPVGLGIGVTWPVSFVFVEHGSDAREDDNACDVWTVLMSCFKDALRTDYSRVVDIMWVFAVI